MCKWFVIKQKIATNVTEQKLDSLCSFMSKQPHIVAIIVHWWTRIDNMEINLTLSYHYEQNNYVIFNYCIIYSCKIRKENPTLYEFPTKLKGRLDAENPIYYSNCEHIKFSDRVELLDEGI